MRINFNPNGEYAGHDLSPLAPAPDAGTSVECDGATNDLLVSILASGHARELVYRGGVLKLAGQAVTIAADGPMARAAKLYAAALVDFRAIADGTTVLVAGDVIPTLRKVCGAIYVLDRLVRQGT